MQWVTAPVQQSKMLKLGNPVVVPFIPGCLDLRSVVVACPLTYIWLQIRASLLSDSHVPVSVVPGPSVPVGTLLGTVQKDQTKAALLKLWPAAEVDKGCPDLALDLVLISSAPMV